MVVGMAAAWWWLHERFSRDARSSAGRQPLRIAGFVFFGAILLSYVAAGVRPIDPLELRSADRGLLLVVGLLGLVFLAADGIQSRDRLDVLLRRVTIGGALLAFVGAAQFFTGFDLAGTLRFPFLEEQTGAQLIQERSDLNRVAATASHPIEFGVVLGLIFPLAVHYALYAKSNKGWAWFRVAIIAAAVPFGVTRSGVLALGVTFLVMWFSWPARLRIRSLVIGVVGAVGMRALVPGLLGTIKALFTNLFYDPSTQGRLNDYPVVERFFSERPITGRGFSTFVAERYPVLDNQYLGLVVETGVVGTAAFVGLYVVGIALAVLAKRGGTDETRSLGQALAAAGIAVIVVAFTFDLLAFTMATTISFLLLGCSGALWRLTAEDRAVANAIRSANVKQPSSLFARPSLP